MGEFFFFQRERELNQNNLNQKNKKQQKTPKNNVVNFFKKILNKARVYQNLDVIFSFKTSADFQNKGSQGSIRLGIKPNRDLDMALLLERLTRSGNCSQG